MRKICIYILSFFLLSVNCNVWALDDPNPTFLTGAEVEMEQIQINLLSGNVLNVKNAEGLTIEIYNITGEKISTNKIDSNNKSIDIDQLQKGWYIVKVGKISRKICIR